jgi:peptidoglycan/LPS O-acetylase OafA/YrhL
MITAKGKILRVVTIITVVITLVLVLYIILNHKGLVPEYDFGAGAYYYADIPTEQYQEIDPDGAYRTTVPQWIFYVLFLGWGWLMWRLWCRISRKD